MVFASYDDTKLETMSANRGDKKSLVKAELREEQAKIDECKTLCCTFGRWLTGASDDPLLQKIREAT